MVRHDEALVPYCYDEMNTSRDSTLVTEELAKKVLKVFCERILKQYIIIDGLDECTPAERQNLVRILTGIVKTCDEKSHLGKPRLLIISQNLGDIERSLDEANSMEFRREDNRLDIKQFVHKRAEELKDRFDLKVELADQIKEFTLEFAHGQITPFPPPLLVDMAAATDIRCRYVPLRNTGDGKLEDVLHSQGV